MSNADWNETEQIAAARRGDLEGFSQLVLRYQAGVRACLAIRMSDPHEAEDLAQEVFVLAFRKLSEFDASRSFSAWLRGMAFNLLRNHQRKSRSRPLTAVGDLDALVSDHLDASHEQGGEADRYSAMRECLQHLDDASRQLVAARYEEDVDVSQLCRRLGKKHSAVTMHLYRIRQQLRACIELRLKST